MLARCPVKALCCANALAQTWTFMQSLASMDAHVSSQSALSSKRFSTNFVYCQSAFNIKSSMAHSAFERLLASMCAKMNCQTALLLKRFIAHCAFERSLACMRAKMSRQMLRTRTRSVARSTHVSSDEHVSSRVFIQTALLIKRSIALSAFERLLASMYKIVSFQITRFRKIFIADFADMCSSSSSSSSFFNNSVVVVSIWNF